MRTLMKILSGLCLMTAASCSENHENRLNSVTVPGTQSDTNLALGSGFSRDFEIFLNKKDSCVTGEQVFVPNPEIHIKSSQDFTLDEAMKRIFMNAQVSLRWDFIVAKAEVTGAVETDLNLLSRDRRVVLFTEVTHRAGSLYLRNMTWSNKFPIGSTPKQILALACGNEVLTRVDLGTSFVVAFDFVANTDSLSSKLKAFVAGKVKTPIKTFTKSITFFDGYLAELNVFQGAAKIYVMQRGGNMGEFEVAFTENNEATQECKLRLSGNSTDEEIETEMGRCLGLYFKAVDYVKTKLRNQIKRPDAVYMVEKPESLTSFAPIAYQFEDYRDLGFDYPEVSDALPRELKATIKMILKRYFALKALIAQLERYKNSGLDFADLLQKNNIADFSSIIRQLEVMQKRILDTTSKSPAGPLLDACQPGKLANCRLLLKKIDDDIKKASAKYSTIRNTLQK